MHLQITHITSSLLMPEILHLDSQNPVFEWDKLLSRN